uniref:Uncharacterized protein n=1 Tax=Falco tinnunculus TaxID=100819 RepID=A0A8C4UNL1_FALTI
GVHSTTSPLYPVSSSSSRNAALSAVSFSSMRPVRQVIHNNRKGTLCDSRFRSLTCRKFQAIAVNWGPELYHCYTYRQLSSPVSWEGLSCLQRLFGSHSMEPHPTLLTWLNHVPLLSKESSIPSP